MIPFIEQLAAYHAAVVPTARNPGNDPLKDRDEFLRANLPDPQNFTAKDVAKVLKMRIDNARCLVTRMHDKDVITRVAEKRPGHGRSQQSARWKFRT